MKITVCLSIVLSALTCVTCKSYFYGQKTDETRLINREKLILFAVPWRRRIEYYAYNDTLQRPIKAIDCHDYQRTEAIVNITEGGIGYPYVTLFFQSQRSYGLEYAIEIFA
ncbi:transcription activator MBF2 domain-containing protein [Phthorimaea operculella]|nr:transcription activator MBF2 domain-containing protein [Phthorimaea operculella]